MSYETILVTREGRVGTITLNRPKALNALNSQVMAELTTAAADFDADAGIGAIIVTGIRQQFIFINQKRYGFSHYDVGLVAAYSLNNLFHASKRYGEWTLNGYLNYTEGVNRDTIHADTKLWGGAGIQFAY